MSEQHVQLVKLVLEAILAMVLILSMTWIILSPASDEVNKAALVVIGSAVGFVFGRQTATP